MARATGSEARGRRRASIRIPTRKTVTGPVTSAMRREGPTRRRWRERSWFALAGYGGVYGVHIVHVVMRCQHLCDDERMTTRPTTTATSARRSSPPATRSPASAARRRSGCASSRSLWACRPRPQYRHFADLDHLVAAVSQRSREQLARTMLEALVAIPADGTPEAAWARLEADRARLRRVRCREPQLFETAFTPCAPTARPDDPRRGTCWCSALEDLAGARRDGRGPPPAPTRSSPGRRSTAWTLLARGLVPADASGPATVAVLDGVKAALRP